MLNAELRMPNSRLAAFVVAMLFLIPRLGAAAGSVPPVSPAVRSAMEAEQAVVNIIRKLVPSYVFIGGGSGVLISADGLMLTNHHVAHSSKRWRVRVGSKFYQADVLGSDPRGDITLLQLKDAQKLPCVEFADSDQLVMGQQVIAIGNPFGAAEITGEPTVTLGIISALHRFHNNYSDAVQTDAPINPGNSGGPLLTLDGKLAGINGMIDTKHGARANTGIGLAIPARQIQRFLPQLKAASGGFVHHGFIRGLVGDAEETDGVQNGAELKEVKPDSPAQKLGLQAGDRVTQVDGYKLLNFARFLGVIGTYPAGSELKLQFERAGKTQSVTAKLEMLAPGSLGVEMHSRLKSMQELLNPPVIEKILPNGAAEKAGLKAEDTILQVDGKPVNYLILRNLMQRSWLAGDSLKLKIRRKKNEGVEELDISITLDSAYQHLPAQPKPPPVAPPPKG